MTPTKTCCYSVPYKEQAYHQLYVIIPIHVHVHYVSVYIIHVYKQDYLGDRGLMKECHAPPPSCLEHAHHTVHVLRAGTLSHELGCLLTVVLTSLLKKGGLKYLLIVLQVHSPVVLFNLHCEERTMMS